MSKIDFSKLTPCGGCCDNCQCLVSGECIGCLKNGGKCVKMWSNGCEIYDCCSRHNVPFCGLCEEFPCEWIIGKLGEWNPSGIDELQNLAEQYRIKE